MVDTLQAMVHRIRLAVRLSATPEGDTCGRFVATSIYRPFAAASSGPYICIVRTNHRPREANVPQQPAEQRPSADSKLTLTLITLGCFALATAFVVGISDNLPGVALLFGSIICFELAVVRRWSRARSFLWLAAAAAFSFFVFGILHNVLYGLGEMASGQPFLHGLCEILHVAFFLVAVLISPPTVAVGLVGFFVKSLVNKRGTHLETEGSP